MLNLIFILAFLAVISCFADCTDYGVGTQATWGPLKPNGMTECDWYHKDDKGVCCPTTYSNTIADDGFYRKTEASPQGSATSCDKWSNKCEDFWRFLDCGRCSPEVSKYWDPVGQQVRVCKGWADSFYEACQEDYFMNADWNCKKFGDSFHNASDFIQSQNFNGENLNYSSSSDCFNGSSLYIMSFTVLSVFVALFI